MNTDMFYYLKPYSKECLGVDYFLRPNGDHLESSSLEVGYTMKSTSQNHLSFYFEDLWEQILPQDYLHLNKLLQELQGSESLVALLKLFCN